MDVKLREVIEEDEEELRKLYYEYINSEPLPGMDTFEGVRDFETLGKMNFKEWMLDLEKNKNKSKLPENYSTHTLYLAINKEEKIVGAIGLRWEEVPVLMRYGGLIGYSVRPKERGKGYATQMLKLGLEKYKSTKKNKDKVLITCKDFNIASKKVIEKNGGIFEDSYYNEDDKYTYLKYWIKLKEKRI